MNIVYLSSTKLGHKCFQLLIKESYKPKAIITIPQMFNISYALGEVKNINYYSFEDIAKKNKIDLYCLNNEEDHQKIIDIIKKYNADLVLVIGWYHRIRKEVLSFPKLGVLGLHASLLPKYRGGAPLVWAMINGEKYAGITLFYMSEKIDGGDIVGQEKIKINEKDDIAKMLKKTETKALKLVKKYIPLILKGKAPRLKQNEKHASVYPQRSPKDGLISWDKKTKDIHNFIRAQSAPYPGAYTLLDGKKIKIWKARREKTSWKILGAPGQVAEIRANKEVAVVTGDGLLILEEIETDDLGIRKPAEIIKSIRIMLGLDTEYAGF